MKKLIYSAFIFSALIMTACGGEKKEEGKKEEKKPVSDETKAKFDALKTDWAAVDGMVQTLDGVLLLHDPDQVTNYIDSLKGVVEKTKKEVKVQALPLLDSLTAINELSREWKSVIEGEKETWGMITEDFTKVNTEIEKGEGDDTKIAPRAEGFTEQFNYKKSVLGPIIGQWTRMEANDKALNDLLAPAK